MTRNEILYLSAGIAVGALAGANFHKIKESLAPLLALAGDSIGDSYAAVAQRVAEQVESIQDTIAEAKAASATPVQT
jgi:hypothetical protein